MQHIYNKFISAIELFDFRLLKPTKLRQLAETCKIVKELKEGDSFDVRMDKLMSLMKETYQTPHVGDDT